MMERQSRITQLASELAAAANYPSGRDMDFWLEAERLVDNNTNNWITSPRILYSSFMQSFFATRDHHFNSEYFDFSDSKDAIYAAKYLLKLNSSSSLFSSMASIKDRSGRGLFDVSILTSTEDIDDIAKRSLLMTDSSLIGSTCDDLFSFARHHDDVQREKFEIEEIKRRNIDTPWLIDSQIRFRDIRHSKTDYLSNVSVLKVNEWLNSLTHNLMAGDLFLMPKVFTKSFDQGYHYGSLADEKIFDAVLHSGHVKTYYTEDPLRQSFIRFLAEVPIPEISNTNLSLFADVYNTEIDHANILKRVLRERFLELDSAKAKLSPETEFLKIGLKIEKEARLAINDIRRLYKKELVQSSGILLGTGVALLVALDVQQVMAAIPFVTGAVGLGALLKLLDSHLDNQQKIEDNPYLFLWLIKKS